MSTIEQKPAEHYVDFEEYVDFQLKKARHQIRSTDLLTAGTVAAVMVVGYLLAFVVADQWLFTGGLPTSWRWIGLTVWMAILATWLVAKFGVPLLKSVTGLFAAHQVEKAEPELQSNLLNWVDLQRAGRPVDPAVLRAIERQAAVQLSKIDVNQAVDHRPLLRSGYALLAVMVLFCLYAVISPKKLSPSLWRVLPMADVKVPTRTEIRAVTPGDADVLARSLLEVTVDLGGDIPKQVRLVYTTSDQKFRDEPVILQPEGEAGTRFRTVLAGERGQGLMRDLTYRIEAGDAVSQDYRVTVAQPPSARVEQIQITPPEYTRLPNETIAGGQFTAWEGSRVALAATVNLPVQTARIEFLDEPNGKPTGEEITVKVQDGTKLSAEWTLEFDSAGKYSPYYRIQCQTADGRTDPAPLVYQHTIRRDQPPELVLLAPERDITVPANAVIPLLAEARDPDFELGPITLQINRADGESLSRETLSPGKKQAVRIQHDLALKPFQLQPGDVISYFLEAQDNRQPRRNRKATPPLKIKIEAPTEDRKVQEQLAEEKARQREQLAELDQLNADRDPNAPNEPPMGDPEAPREPRQPNEEPRESNDEPMPREAEQDANQRNDGQEKSATGQNGKTGNESGENGDEQKFSPDGQDDQELLEKLLERYKNEQQQKPGEKQGQPSPSHQDGNQPQNAEQASPDGKQRPGSQPSESGDQKGPQPDPTGKQPPSTRTAKDDRDPNAPMTGEPKPDGNQMDRNDAASSDQNKGRESNPSAKPNGPGEAPKNDEPQKGNASDPNGNEQPNAKPMADGDNPMKGDQPSSNPMPDATGQNRDGQKNAASNQTEKGADGPMNSGKPSGNEQTASGETPDGQSGSKASSKNQEKAAKPGQKGSEPTEGEPSKTSSPMKGDPSAATGEQSQSPDKQPGSQNTQKRDGAPDGGETSPKGSGRPNPQRSDQPQAGESGGSQQAQDGDPGSRQRGPGESTGRPGEQERGATQSREMQPNAQQPGQPSQTGSKQPGGQTPTGQQPGDQQNAGGKVGDDGQQPGEQQPGGEKSAADENRPAGDQPPKGNESGGDQKSGNGKQSPQQSGAKSKNGDQQQSESQPSGGEKSGGKEGGGKEGGGKEGGKPGGKDGGSGGKGGGKPGGGQKSEEIGTPEGMPTGEGGDGGLQQPLRRPGGNQQPNDNGAGEGAAGETPAGDPANLEFKKQAAELVLQRLKDGLDRGDIDPKLLEELGWTADEMQRFVNRLSQSLHQGDNAESPESLARRVQFEEMLRSLNLNRTGSKRTAGQQPTREVDQIEARRAPVPGEYRKAWERYTQQLSKQPAQKP